MCVLAVKYLPEYGWVGCKNRDRNYKPTIKLIQSTRDGIEAVFIRDSVTKYSEGVNEYGIGILNTATSVKNDESAAAVAHRWERQRKKSDGTYVSPDGVVLRRALRCTTVKEALQVLIDARMTGHTAVFDEKECYILEGGRSEEDFEKNMAASEADPTHEWSKMDYQYKVKKIDQKDCLVRTNHGHFMPWLGYQSDDLNFDFVKSRESSEFRHTTVIRLLKDVTTPSGMFAAISNLDDKNSQMNPVRLGGYNNKKILKTTGQLMIIPKERRLIYRPIWCNIDQSTNMDRISGQKTSTFADTQSFSVPNNRKSVLEHVSQYQINNNEHKNK